MFSDTYYIYTTFNCFFFGSFLSFFFFVTFFSFFLFKFGLNLSLCIFEKLYCALIISNCTQKLKSHS